MDIEIQLGPGSSAAKVSLVSGETLTAEGGSMIAMSNDMSLTTSTYKKNKGGVLKALKRMVSGESFFMNHYEPGPNGGNVYLATALPGDMMTMELNGQGLVVQGGSYVASSHDIEIDFITEALPCKLIGMNSKLMIEYIKYIANRLASQLGYKEIYPKVEQPFSFMDRIGLTEKSNFFEQKSATYRKHAKKEDSEEGENPFGNISSFDVD